MLNGARCACTPLLGGAARVSGLGAPPADVVAVAFAGSLLERIACGVPITECHAGSSVATRRSAGRLAAFPASERDECALPHRTFGGRLLRFRGEPGPQRRSTPAPWPDMPHPPDARLPHQDALSHASTEQPAAAMAITPGARTVGGPRSGAGIPRRAWPAAAPCARAVVGHAAPPDARLPHQDG
jgi:hypothetical protein